MKVTFAPINLQHKHEKSLQKKLRGYQRIAFNVQNLYESPTINCGT